MQRPRVLTFVMWFTGIYAVGAVIGILAAAAGVRHYSIGGMSVTREQWFTIAAPLIAVVAFQMALTCLGLRRHRAWSRITLMSVWPTIAAYGLGSGILGALPWSLALRAVIDAAVFAVLCAWLLFRHKASVGYFKKI